MQTTQRKKDEGEETQRREGRPLHFADTGVPFQSEAHSGFPTSSWGPGTTWGPGGFRNVMDDGSHGQGFGFAPNVPQGAYGPYGSSNRPWQEGPYAYTPQSQPVQPFPQAFSTGFPNPFASLVPTLSYGLAGITDLVTRGIALATAQGQAVLSAIGAMQPGMTQQGANPRPSQVAWPMARIPAIDLVDEGAELVCQVELPGVKTENVDVSCFGRGVLITARSEPEIDVGALVQAERGLQATYRRAINLPVNVQPSGAKATLRDGVLTINLPKANPTEGPRRVPVS